MSESESCSESDEMSEDSVEVETVIAREYDEKGLMVYKVTDPNTELYMLSRSDLMDGGRNQQLILSYERRLPPDWDPVCPVCGSDLSNDDGCEECWCPECDDKCRFKFGNNYGCIRHPVV